MIRLGCDGRDREGRGRGRGRHYGVDLEVFSELPFRYLKSGNTEC